MCGIVGRTGYSLAASIILQGLQSLEYRGYDSAGMVTFSDGKLWLKKDVGWVADIDRKHHLQHLPEAKSLGQKVVGSGPGRIRTYDQPVMSRSL